MKCQNCGKDGVNFHYSSSVNGHLTQAHLCSECAEQSGVDFGRMFGGFFPFAAQRAQMPMQMPMAMRMFGFNPASMFIAWPQAELPESECECGGVCEAPLAEASASEVDSDMQKRRELNVMKEQMRLAAEKEEFEKAVELRDQIRQMEAEYNEN